MSIPDFISGALPIFKENVMASSLLLNFLRGFEDFPDVFPYSHLKIFFLTFLVFLDFSFCSLSHAFIVPRVSLCCKTVTV